MQYERQLVGKLRNSGSSWGGQPAGLVLDRTGRQIIMLTMFTKEQDARGC